VVWHSEYRLQLNQIHFTTKEPQPKADYMNSVAVVEKPPQEIKEETTSRAIYVNYNAVQL